VDHYLIYIIPCPNLPLTMQLSRPLKGSWPVIMEPGQTLGARSSMSLLVVSSPPDSWVGFSTMNGPRSGRKIKITCLLIIINPCMFLSSTSPSSSPRLGDRQPSWQQWSRYLIFIIPCPNLTSSIRLPRPTQGLWPLIMEPGLTLGARPSIFPLTGSSPLASWVGSFYDDQSQTWLEDLDHLPSAAAISPALGHPRRQWSRLLIYINPCPFLYSTSPPSRPLLGPR